MRERENRCRERRMERQWLEKRRGVEISD